MYFSTIHPHHCFSSHYHCDKQVTKMTKQKMLIKYPWAFFKRWRWVTTILACEYSTNKTGSQNITPNKVRNKQRAPQDTHTKKTPWYYLDERLSGSHAFSLFQGEQMIPFTEPQSFDTDIEKNSDSTTLTYTALEMM